MGPTSWFGRTTRAWLLALAVAFSSAAALASQNFTPIAAAENLPNTLLTPAPPRVDAGSVLASSSGGLCVLGLEEQRLFARSSSDGGRSFSAETTIDGDGASGQRAVFEHSAALAPDGAAPGRVYVAYTVADPAGGFGLRFARSDDGGRTWTTPVDLVQRGAASFGVAHPALAAGPGDLVAVMYQGAAESAPYVIVSLNAGGAWAAPQALDEGAASGVGAPEGHKLAIDDSGQIFAAYSRLHAGARRVYLARSRTTTGGAIVFDSAQNLSALTPDSLSASAPDLVARGAGEVVVAFVDQAATDHLYALHSADQGQTFALALDQQLSGDTYFQPRLFAAAGTDVVLLLFAQAHTGQPVTNLEIHRSQDFGVSYAAPVLQYGLAAETGANFAAVRIATGAWVAAWTDGVADPYFGALTDIYAADSPDDGASWYPDAFQVNGGTPGTCARGLIGLAPSDADGVFYLYSDGRDSADRGAGLYANHSVGDPMAADPADARVDTDLAGAAVSPGDVGAPAISADGDGMVYVAFSALATGPFHDVYVAASSDGGYTFAPPAPVGDSSPSVANDLAPTLASTAEGYVYLVYQSDDGARQPVAARELRFNYSTDYGATWRAADIVLDANTGLHPVDSSYDIPSVQLATTPGGAIYIAWSDGDRVKLLRGRWAGGTLTLGAAATVDGGVAGGGNQAPRLCAQRVGAADQLTLVFVGENDAGAGETVWGRISDDGGLTWSARRDLRQSATAGEIYTPLALACDETNQAVAVWTERQRPAVAAGLRAAGFDGAAWAEAVSLPGPGNADAFTPDAAFSSAGRVIVSFEDASGRIYTSRSTDAGASFPPGAQYFQRLDPSSPDSLSLSPHLTSDGLGGVWVNWIDYEPAYYGAVVARRSADDGASFDPGVQLNTPAPPGANPVWYDLFPMSASAPGVAYFAFTGWRTGTNYETVVQAYDPANPSRDPAPAPGDANGSSRVDGFDLARLGRAFGKACREPGYDRHVDFDRSCLVDGADLSALAVNFGKSAGTQ